MGLNASKVKGSSSTSSYVQQPTLEPDVYPAYLVQIIDLGLQPQRAHDGVAKPPCAAIMLTYELSDAFMLDDEGNEREDKPRWISEQITFRSLKADLAKSTKRYYALDPDGVHGGDFEALLGAPCNVTIVTKEKGDRVYENVGNVSAISPRKVAAMNPLKNPTKSFSLDDPDLDVFFSLPEWLQTLIKSNLEFSGSPLESLLESASSEGKTKEKAKPSKPPARKKVVEEAEEEAAEPNTDDAPWD
jgi:hypothetical protein